MSVTVPLTEHLNPLIALRAEFEGGTIGKPEYTRRIWELHSGLFHYSAFLRNTNVAAIEIDSQGVAVRLQNPDLKLWCSLEDQRHVAIASLNYRQYELQELTAFLQLARTSDIIFDIGANVGFYSIAIGQRFPEASIVAFEPIPNTFRELTRNLALNRITNVAAHNLGLSDQIAEAPFYFDPTVSGAASGAPLGSEFGATETLACPVETLDSFTQRTGIVPGIIKCDVEGGELKVFRGARHTLEQHKPIVFTEMLRKWSARFGYHPNDLIAFFRQLGYDCFSLANARLHPFSVMSETTVETNFFFLHTQRHLEMVRFLGLLA